MLAKQGERDPARLQQRALKSSGQSPDLARFHMKESTKRSSHEVLNSTSPRPTAWSVIDQDDTRNCEGGSIQKAP
jgi:hypothetical protein